VVRLILFALLLTLGCTAQPTKDNVLSACDVLTHLQDYRGKEILVRGILRSTDEGLYLVPAGAEKCLHTLDVSGYEWRDPVFNLVQPGSPMVERPDLRPHTYVPIPEVPVGSRRERWVIVSARVESREHLTMVLIGNRGQTVPYGYGHLNRRPAQLVYNKVESAFPLQNEPIPERSWRPAPTAFIRARAEVFIIFPKVPRVIVHRILRSTKSARPKPR
jgi:hypothetical protein